MAANIINKIILQDELPTILTVEISHETQIKGHHLYKDIWAPEFCFYFSSVTGRILVQETGKMVRLSECSSYRGFELSSNYYEKILLYY